MKKSIMNYFSMLWKVNSLLWCKFCEAVTFMLCVFELLAFIPCCEGFMKQNCVRVVSLILIIVISLFYACCKVFRKKDEITLEINKRTNVTIRRADLMKANGVRVIPVNEYFDTHLGDGIINEYSLHGQLLKMFDGRIDILRNMIDVQLSTMQPLPKLRTRTLVPDLPQDRYPLGTCVRVYDGNDIYILVALTRFNEQEHVDVAAEEYPEVARRMFHGVNNLHDGNSVYMPLLGSGISGYKLTNMQLLNLLLQAASESNVLTVTQGITICLYDEKQMDSLNLNIAEYLFDFWKTLK